MQKPAVGAYVPRELPDVIGGANNQSRAGVHDRGVAAGGGRRAADSNCVVQVKLPEPVTGGRNRNPLEGVAAVVARVSAAQSKHATARVVEIKSKDASVDEMVLHELVERRDLLQQKQMESEFIQKFISL